MSDLVKTRCMKIKETEISSIWYLNVQFRYLKKKIEEKKKKRYSISVLLAYLG